MNPIDMNELDSPYGGSVSFYKGRRYSGKPSKLFEYVPGYFRRRIFRRETLSCRCGQYIINAPAPERTTDKTQYGPGFIAHLKALPSRSSTSISTPVGPPRTPGGQPQLAANRDVGNVQAAAELARQSGTKQTIVANEKAFP